jgi:4-diphosphocytidyl-2-C-methyl-D-erythritol kinase
MSVVVRAYAKINLGLRILRERPDGFHDIETVFHRISLWDEIRLEQAQSLEVISDDPLAPGDSSNICTRAARSLQSRLDCTTGVRISLTKRIPVGAGLGGGSSDGAAVLHALPRFWGRSLEPPALRGLALELGSDVPYFLGSGSALGRGRGEDLEYFPLALPWAILVCYPGIPVPTAWAYRQITPSPRSNARELREIILAGVQDPAILRAELENDFEHPVFATYPEIARVKEILLSRGALYGALSGSGSSVYGFFPDEDHAESVAQELRGRGLGAFITPPAFLPPEPL